MEGAFRGFEVRGRGGQRLVDRWSEEGGPRLLKGMYPGPDFPNCACLLGPLSHPSTFPSTARVQSEHLLRVIERLRGTEKARSFAARAEAVDRYVEKLADEFEGSVYFRIPRYGCFWCCWMPPPVTGAELEQR